MKREIVIYGNDKPDFILIQCVDEHDIKGLENEYKYIEMNTNKAIMIVALKMNDWNNELSPWYAPAVFGGNDFKGNANDTLDYIERELVPDLKSKYSVSDNTSFIIGGYSLAGLFALWCGYQSDKFYGVAAASPSVWFKGWMDFAKENRFNAKKVYLSLGDKEEKTRNKIMVTVGDNIREQFKLFQDNNIDCTLEWNEGNHFKDSDIRMAKAFVNIIWY